MIHVVEVTEQVLSRRKMEALTRQLLSFLRRQAINPTVTRIADRIAAVQPILASSIGTVALGIAMSADLWPVKVDTNEFDLALEVPLAQTGAHRQRLEKEKEQLEKNIANYRRQLADETATSKKPAKVVEDMRQKLAGYEAQLAKTKSALDALNES